MPLPASTAEPQAPAAVRTTACPVCHGAAWEEIAPGRGRFGLFACRGCGCHRIEMARPSADATYRDYYAGASARRLSGIFDWLFRMIRRGRATRLLARAPAGSRVCDIGCERGELLHELQRAGWRVRGTQLSRAAADFARERFGIDVFVGELPDAPWAREPHDVVLMTHVLEHLPDPERYLEQVSRMVKSGGLFWVEVPNTASWTARVSGKRWLHHDPEHHYWNFSAVQLARLLDRYGFDVERTDHYSWEFGPIGCLQSWLNALPGPSDVIFGIVRRGLSAEPKRLAIQMIHMGCSIVLLPAACLVATLESALGQGQVVQVRARKR